MPLHPQARAFLDNPFIAALKPVETLTVGEARAQYSRLMRAAPPGDEVASVEDRAIPGPLGAIPIRIYTPIRAHTAPLPIYAFFHGGGWVLGDLEVQNGECRTLANQVGARRIGRLPPRPGAQVPRRARRRLRRRAVGLHQRRGARRRRPSVGGGGTSSGANLAAVVALLARERADWPGPPIAFQLLNVPVTNHDFATAS